MKHYAKRDTEALGDHYTRHVEAMTAEGLHSKAAIAAELAWRDATIEALGDDLRHERTASRDGYDEVLAERDALRKDVADAAGELLVSIPEPGTEASKLLIANSIMRRQRDEAWDKQDALVAERDALRRLLDEHRRFHGAVACPGLPECHVCAAEEAALAASAPAAGQGEPTGGAPAAPDRNG